MKKTSLTRRQLLKASAVAGAGLMLPLGWSQRILAAPLTPTNLTRFVDPLPLPAVLQPSKIVHGVPFFQVTMSQFTQQLHRDLAPTTVWGYNGTYPGPTIEARRNRAIKVQWINQLPTTHLLPIDHTLAGAGIDVPDVRNVAHLHGGHVPPESDGGPTDWFVPGQSRIFDYPNLQRAASLWYHDHALAITRLNVYAGLAGLYLLRDAIEDHLNLPSGAFEIPLVIQDRSFTDEGQLFYPNTGVTDVHRVWVPEFFGDTALVNGKVWPFLEVQPRKYRFRIYNGSNARFYNLSLSSGRAFHQIGAEGGFLPVAVDRQEILLSPAERADVILDFSGLEGATITLNNNATAPFPGGGEFVIPEIMQFKVTLPLSEPDTSSLPGRIPSAPEPPEQSAVKVRDLTLQEVLQNGNPLTLLLDGLHFEDPITEKPHLGTTEIWRLINLTGDTHPIHLHLVQFHVLDRQPFNVDVYNDTKQLVFTDSPTPRGPNETGPKDTVRANPGEVTRIIVPFKNFTGKYVWHCHILEHEDNDMMRPYEVVTGHEH